MEPQHNTDTTKRQVVDDSATLYLCRQGSRWVVVLESPRIWGALRLRHVSRDAYDARFELLSRARRACPDAAIVSTDGAVVDADYEWRLDVQGVRTQSGDIGQALHQELSSEAATHETRAPQRRRSGTLCHWGLSAKTSGRPRSF